MAEKAAAVTRKSEAKQKCSNSCKQNIGFDSSGSPADLILQLQRTAGNQAVKRLIKSRALQAKLRIGQPNDLYEPEADRVAEQVMRMPDPILQRKCPKCNKDEKILQAKESAGQVLINERQDVPTIVHEVIRSPGQPLDPSTQAFMEPRFGYDFSKVRVHTDEKAKRSATSVNSLAYTVGYDIVFGSGMYELGTARGKQALAHELVHVIQQEDGLQRLQNQNGTGSNVDPFERGAERVMAKVAPEAEDVEEIGSEEVRGGLFPIEQQAAYSLVQNVAINQPDIPSLSQIISKIQGEPNLQRLCSKPKVEAGYPINVNMAIPITPAPDHSKNTNEISALAKDASNQTSGLTVLNAGFNYRIGITTRGDRSWITNMQVWLQSPHIQIYITKDMTKNSCEYRDLLRHERRHDRDFRTNYAEAETRICERAVAWPSSTRPLLTAVLSATDLRTQVEDWLRLEVWNLEYENWLSSCIWDLVDYPKLYTSCPGTNWSAPAATCTDAPPRPKMAIFPLPTK